jgi:hypothetical protein
VAKLKIFAWWWGDKYGPDYVSRLAAGLRRHLEQPYLLTLCRPQADDEYLTKVPGCLCRLRMFDPAWQGANGIEDGDRIVCIDLDVVITGKLDPLFYRPEPFMILQGANAQNPCPYNGSVFMLRAGYRPDVWSDFSLDAAAKVPHDRFPDDQAWLAHKLPNAIGWRAGSQSGIFAFKKPGWPHGDSLPADARMVVFPGWRDPSKFAQLPWIKEHWRT